MATLWITQYTRLAVESTGQTVLVGQEPAKVQTATISGTSNLVTLQQGTRFVRLNTDTACHVRFDGADASPADERLAANQTEYFGVTGPSLTVFVGA